MSCALLYLLALGSCAFLLFQVYYYRKYKTFGRFLNLCLSSIDFVFFLGFSSGTRP
uniref:Uncharacterized protein n=1 Tax=Neogobius melanostomus TaxID=47308 RepID=A0A8C6SH42_9GOBI